MPGKDQLCRFSEYLDETFKITQEGSTLVREIRGGLVTFMTTSYLVFLNPQILSLSGLPAGGCLTATCLVTAVATSVAGILTNLPVCLAPGMGLNTFFVVGLVEQANLQWPAALAAVSLSGVLLGVLAFFGVSAKLRNGMSDGVMRAIPVSIGFYQGVVGFQLMHLLVRDSGHVWQVGSLRSPEVLIGLGGLLGMSVLIERGVQGAVALGIVGVSVALWLVGLGPKMGAEGSSTLSDVGLQLDLPGFLANPQGWVSVGALSLIALLDVYATLISIFSGIQDLTIRSILLCTGMGNLLAGLAGTSSVIVVAETATGYQDGARTGLASLVIAACFALAPLLGPLLSLIPRQACAPPLILIGVFMAQSLKMIDWESFKVALPAFIIILLVPLTGSIAEGVLLGLLIDKLLWCCTTAKHSEVAPLFGEWSPRASVGGTPPSMRCQTNG